MSVLVSIFISYCDIFINNASTDDNDSVADVDDDEEDDGDPVT